MIDKTALFVTQVHVEQFFCIFSLPNCKSLGKITPNEFNVQEVTYA